eukprot:TRINITY_DN3695_c0_g1_i1.p1 TRINITY_DN3695_c0_g1~~TRINITY_DN3695_c0_g1_i1.p1  ORF type:complete len:242 (-),score=80.45 TRINITY_DN3695_c0_g1_i1:129-818(-)
MVSFKVVVYLLLTASFVVLLATQPPHHKTHDHHHAHDELPAWVKVATDHSDVADAGRDIAIASEYHPHPHPPHHPTQKHASSEVHEHPGTHATSSDFAGVGVHAAQTAVSAVVATAMAHARALVASGDVAAFAVAVATVAAQAAVLAVITTAHASLHSSFVISRVAPHVIGMVYGVEGSWAKCTVAVGVIGINGLVHTMAHPLGFKGAAVAGVCHYAIETFVHGLVHLH